MPTAPPAVNDTTGDSEQAKTAPRPAAPGDDRRNGQTPLARDAAGRTRPAPACSEITGGTTAEIAGTRPRRFDVLLRRIPKTRGFYADPLFERPDLVEDDYYRFRRQHDS
jgi:hypothetical protein